MTLGLPERIEAKISPEPNSGCWLWTAQTIWGGYGRVRWKKRKMLAHVACYEILVGEIPEGLELDHACRVRCCVNPEHLEPVTHRVNTLRGEGVAGKNARKTHCPQGHEYTVENTQVWKTYRYCRICHAQHCRNYRNKK